MNRILYGLLTMALIVLSTLSCSDKSITDPSAIALNDSTTDASLVYSAAISLSRDTIAVGDTTRAIATLRDRRNQPLYQRITWGSSDSSIATISSSGLVTGVAPGTVTITATRGTRSASTTLTVVPLSTTSIPVASVGVDLAASSLVIGQTTQATATTRDAGNNVLTGRTVVWTSSDQAVATVSASGVVTAVAAGVAQIIASSEGKSGQAALTVSAAPPVAVASVTVSPSSSSILIGGTVQLAAVTKDANGNVLTGRAISWSSANTAVATVSGAGRVTAVGAGTTAITATSEGVSGTASITVAAPPPPPPPPPPGDVAEPRPGAGSTIVFQDDFERYDGTCQSLVTIGHWATSDENCNNPGSSVITTPDGTGSLGTPTGIGGRSARWNWPISTTEQFYILDRSVSGFSGRQPEYFTYDYRAPNFVYVGAYPRVGKKMFLLIVGDGSTGRVTINPSAWGLQQSNGVHLNPTFDQWPTGLTSEAAFLAYLTNGQWHRYTIMRLPESSNGAMDGMIRIWVDGYLVVNWTQVGTYTGNTSGIDLAGTFNGGSSKAQTEYYDNVIVWR